MRPFTEQRPEQFNLGVRWRIFCNRLALLIRTAGFGHRSAFRNGNMCGHTKSVLDDYRAVEITEAESITNCNLLLHLKQKYALLFICFLGTLFSMQPKTEELLYLLLWSADMLMWPTFRNLTDSFESWAYRNKLSRQIAKLEQLRLLERDRKATGDRLYRLTEEGRIHALGGRDPAAQWSRHWDGRWRSRFVRRSDGTAHSSGAITPLFACA